MIQDPDHAIIQAIANGSTQALDELYARYGPAVLNFLVARLNSREVAEEVLQDVMLAVWHNAAGFRGDSKVLTWLLTIARNRAINTYRKRKPDVVEFNDELDLHGDETGPLERVVKQDRYEAVKAALDTLPSDHREVLILVFYHQLTGNEIAEVLGTPVGTVKSRLHRAKESLRRVLTSEGRL